MDFYVGWKCQETYIVTPMTAHPWVEFVSFGIELKSV